MLLRRLHLAADGLEKRATLGLVGELDEQDPHVLTDVALEDVRLQLAQHRGRVARRGLPGQRTTQIDGHASDPLLEVALLRRNVARRRQVAYMRSVSHTTRAPSVHR